MYHWTFEELRAHVMNLSQKGDNIAAADLLEQHQHRFPEHVYMVTWWRIASLCLADCAYEALALLKESVHQGMWYSPALLRTDSDFEALHRLPEFEDVLRICDDYQNAEAAKGTGGYTYYNSLTPSSDLLIALHGNYSNAENHGAYWKQGTEMGFDVLLPQSTQPVAPQQYAKMYVWDDQQRGTADVLSSLREHRTRTHQTESSKIVAGFSAGASLSLRMATTGALDVQGFIAVAPARLDVDALAREINHRNLSHLTGYIVVGLQDNHSMELSERLAALLNEHHMDCRVETQDNLGHAYPEKFAQTLRTALSHISGRGI